MATAQAQPPFLLGKSNSSLCVCVCVWGDPFMYPPLPCSDLLGREVNSAWKCDVLGTHFVPLLIVYDLDYITKPLNVPFSLL